MQSDLLTLATALMLGFLHALEVDHMIAVTAFVTTRPPLRTAAVFGARWGIGHSIAVLALGGGLLLTGLHWPARYDALGEAVVGVMLAGLGAWAVGASRKLHLHPPTEHGDHLHLHVHGRVNRDATIGAAGHQHRHNAEHPAGWPHHHHAPGHTHEGRRHGITLVGLVHGFAGSSAVVALVPVTLIHRLGLGFGYLAAFGIGVTAAMSVYAFIAALAMRQAAERSLIWGRRIAAGVGLAGIAVGIWWVWSALSPAPPPAVL